MHTALRRHLLSTPLRSDHCGTAQAQVVRVLAAAEERLRNRHPQALPGAQNTTNSALHRLQTFSKWTVPSPSPAQVAEAGFALLNQSCVRHFAAINQKQATFDMADKRGRQKLQRYIRERVFRGQGPPGAAWNVPLATAINALMPMQAPLADIDQSDLSLGGQPPTPGGAMASPLQMELTSYCRQSRLLVTGTDDGMATVWTCQPSLFSLVSWNVRQPLTRSHDKAAHPSAEVLRARALIQGDAMPPAAGLDAAQAQDIAEMGRLVHLGLVGSRVLLGLRFVVSIFTDEDLGSMVRLAVCEPMLARFLRANRAPDGSYRCGDVGWGSSTWTCFSPRPSASGGVLSPPLLLPSSCLLLKPMLRLTRPFFLSLSPFYPFPPSPLPPLLLFQLALQPGQRCVAAERTALLLLQHHGRRRACALPHW